MTPYTNLSKYYDELVDESWYKNWYSFYLKATRKFKVKANLVIDAACGTGRLCVYLALKAKVIGVDQSAGMLKIAKARCPHAIFLKKAFVSFSTKSQADVLICSYDSLNYLPEEKSLLQTFQNFHKCLRVGGLFLFDMNGEKAFAYDGKTTRNEKVINHKEGSITWKNIFYKNKWIAEFTFYDQKGKIIGKETHKENFFPWQRVCTLLKKAGFELVEVVSSPNFDPIQPLNNRYFFIARRRETAPNIALKKR